MSEGDEDEVHSKRLTLSGSSAQTFRPGLARSGKTHSFDGFANTFPAEEEVSLLPLAIAWVGTGPLAEEAVEVEAVLGRETMGGREGIAIFPFPLELLDRVVGRALSVEEEGRAAILEFIVVLSGRGSATDMTV